MAERAPAAIEARGVAVAFGAQLVLEGIDLAVASGTRTVVLGANGAGKSVLLRVLHGLIVPTSGEVRSALEGGRPATQAMVFQRPVLLRRSALANVEYALAVRGVRGAEAKARAREALECVGLAPIASRPARVLSGGEQQRLALARAWALRPRVLFLDEPTASLDPGAAAEVERIAGVIHAAGTTVVMTTHHLGLARRFADEIVFLAAGRLAERAPADRFFTAPASREAQAFLKGELPWNGTSPHSSPA